MNINQVDNLNQMRMIAQASLEQKNIPDLINAALRNRTYLPSLNEAEEIMFKIRTELINYINEAGIVHGFVWDGNDWPIENGKIVISKEMIYDVVKKFEFLDADEVTNLVNNMFDAQFVVRDENYVHTDNNFTDEDVAKLGDIEAGAEVNKVIDVQVDGTTVLNPETRVADITPESIKNAYESNTNTNAFTDAEKVKLEGIDAGAEKNNIHGIFENGLNVLDENGVAKITAVEDNSQSLPTTESGTNWPCDWKNIKLRKKIAGTSTVFSEFNIPDQAGLIEWCITMRNDHDNLGQQVQEQQADINKLNGGTAGQILSKKTDSDLDMEWIDPPKTEVIKKYDQKSYLSINTGPGAITDKFTYKIIQIGDVAFFYYFFYGTHYPVADYTIDITDLIDPSKELGMISENAQLVIFTKENATSHNEPLSIYVKTSDRMTNPNKITLTFYSPDSSENISARGSGMIALPLYDK